MIEKHFIHAQELLEDSFLLARRILESDFRPNFIVGIWRGGTPVGIAVQEMLDYCGVHADHIAIRTSSYEGIDNRSRTIQVHGLNYIVRKINAEDRLLIVDDVYDTGLSIQAVIDSLQERCRKNMPRDLRVATVYYKPTRNRTGKAPEYFIHETDKWLVFPHEVKDLAPEEIAREKPYIHRLLPQAKEPR